MTVDLIKKELWTQTRTEGGIREEHHAKTGVIQPQDEGHLGLPEVAKDSFLSLHTSEDPSSYRYQRDRYLANTSLPDFQPSEL